MLRTQGQRRRLCSACPIARVTDLVGDPCSLLVIRDLLDRPQRFGELEDSLGGMSPRTLTKTLRRLEKSGIIVQKRFKKPARSHYELTKKGKALERIVDAMRVYGNKYL
jgi:DNA-binding HxlR family transcriptional regulator